MILSALEGKLHAVLRRHTSSGLYPGLVGTLAFGVTLSMTIPFASVLVFAVLLKRNRWKSIVLSSSLGSTAGGVSLYLIFHHLGWARLAAAYPALTQSSAWTGATQWLARYGILALLGIAASPLPQTPALMFAGIHRLPLVEVLLALFCGKLLKYGVYSWTVATFPERFWRLLHGTATDPMSASPTLAPLERETRVVARDTARVSSWRTPRG